MREVDRIIGNARRLGIDAFHTAAALDIVAPLEGRTWVNLCCWCLDRDAPATPDDLVHRVADACAGGCARCAYFGPDTLVVSLERAATAHPDRADDSTPASPGSP